MPSNYVLLNNGTEYYVADCKMDELINWLDNNSLRKQLTPGSGEDDTS